MRLAFSMLASGLAVAAMATDASAATHRPRHRVVSHHPVYRAYVRYVPYPPPYYAPLYAPYYGGYGPGAEEVLRETARAQTEPGVTNELSPGTRQTATGGPVGGIPNFSGGNH